jgi:hypothetical protein
MAEATTGRRWVDSAWTSKEKANAMAKLKAAESSSGTKYEVLHAPVND